MRRGDSWGFVGEPHGSDRAHRGSEASTLCLVDVGEYGGVVDDQGRVGGCLGGEFGEGVEQVALMYLDRVRPGGGGCGGQTLRPSLFIRPEQAFEPGQIVGVVDVEGV